MSGPVINGDGGECDRLIALKAGHALTERDLRDIGNLIADFKDVVLHLSEPEAA